MSIKKTITGIDPLTVNLVFDFMDDELIVLAMIQYTYKNITKTRLYNFDPLKPHFYIVKLGFTGVYTISLISVQNIDCGYSLEPPHIKT